MKDIRPELRARLDAVRAKRIADRAAYKVLDDAMAAAETRLLGLLQDEETLWVVAPAAGTNGTAKNAHSPEVPSLRVLALEFLAEGIEGHPTNVIAAAAQNRGYQFKPKGASRAANMTLQNLAYNGLVKSHGGVWHLTPEGRAEVGKLKSERHKEAESERAT